MKKRLFITSAMVLLLVFFAKYAVSGDQKAEGVSQEQLMQNMHRIQIPFIANNGQVDERVTFYANTFGGTVFVTNDGEIVYSLPKSANDDSRSQETGVRIQKCRGELHSPDVIHDAGCGIHVNGNLSIADRESCIKDNVSGIKPSILNSQSEIHGVALREKLVGASAGKITGEQPAVTKINYFKGSDPSKWKSNITTYDVVNLGEVYKGIELKLKAYGSNVEKLFYVKPGADPNQIKINLSGIRESKSEVGRQKSDVIALSLNSEFRNPILLINEHGEPSRLGEACPEPTERACPEPVEWAERTQQNNITKGASGLWVNEQGQLVAETELGPVIFTKPVAYQEIDGKRVDVAVEYEIYAVPQVVHRNKPVLTSGRNAKNAKESIVGNTESAGNVCPPLAGVKGVERDSPHVIQPTTNPKSKIVNLSSTEIGDPKLEYGFKVASYDKTKELVIDPLLASTFLGGSGDDTVKSIAIGSDGDVYVAGYTSSSDFPTTTGIYDTSYNGSWDEDDEEYDTDVFVAKLSGDLTILYASTYLGGSGYDYGNSITIDASGNVYVTGETYSTNFPATSDAYDASLDGYSDAFVSKLNGDLTNLLASTYLGGTIGYQGYSRARDESYSIIADSNGDVYVAGRTNSSDFPTTTGAYDTSFNASYSATDAFISKLSGDLTSLLASTYLGGDYTDFAGSVAIDSNGDIYVTGGTYVDGFPTTVGAYDTSRKGDGEVFVSKFSGDLTNLLASTFLSGSYIDSEEYDYDFDSYATSIAIDSNGNVYITGETHSSDFPTTSGAYDTSYNGDTEDYPSDVFIAKLNGELTSLLASTYLGGSYTDWANAIIVDSDGNVYVTGKARSSDFPTTTGAYDTSSNSYNDAFVSKMDGDLTSLLASTYLGELSICNSLAKDSGGNVYVAGGTSSKKFPTTAGAYDTSYNDGDAFVSKLDSNLSADDAVCKAKKITTDPEKKMTIKKNQSDTVTVSVLGLDGCFVEGTVVKAKLSKGSEKKISVSSSETTDADGKATFTVTAYNKKGAAKIVFSTEDIKKKAKIKVKVK